MTRQYITKRGSGHSKHRCNKRFYVFYSGHVFNVFLFFLCFLFLKNVVKSKVWICKNPARNTLRGCLTASAMIFLLILVC